MAKLTALLMFISFMQISAKVYSQAGKLDLKVKNVTILEVFEEIEDNTNYRFFYDNDLVDLSKIVTINTRQKEVYSILNKLLEGTDLTYEVKEQLILVQSKNAKLYSQTNPQQKTITGKVTDESGGPLPGVTLIIKGTTNGTISDIDGKFSLSNIPGDATLVFSFVGMITQEVAVGDQTSINVTMLDDAIMIEEVVAIGYGTMKKANLTGAVGVANSDRLESRSITSVGQGLQGVIPGLNITYNTGDPAESADFNIRGFESINGGAPLVLVDGIPIDPSRINPNDIESVSVLKDASAAAVYGARAAFGVILITTKKGIPGKAKINFSAQLTMNKPIYLGYDPISQNQAGMVRQEMNDAYMLYANKDLFPQEVIDAAINYQEITNPTEQDAYFPYNGDLHYLGYVDAADEFLRDNAMQQKYDLSISGATEKASYYVSLGAVDKPGFYKYGNEDYSRYNVLSKVDYKITDWLSIEEKISINLGVTDNPHSYSRYDGYRQVWSHPFFIPTEFPDLDYYLEPGDKEKYEDLIGMHNGYMDINPYRKDGGRNKTKQNDIWLTQGITITPFKGLKIKGDFSYNSFSSHREDVHTEVNFVKGNFSGFNLGEAPYTTPNWSSPTNMLVSEYNNNYYVLNTYAEYVPENTGSHFLKFMAGYNQEYGLMQNFYAQGYDLINDNVQVVGATSGNQKVGQTKNEIALRGMFYRLNYSYKEKYLFEASGRYDGTSRFPKDSRFGFFPSFSMGWRMSEEAFMDWTDSWLDNMKIRASYGELGNQNVGEYYPYIPSMANSTTDFLLDASGDNPKFLYPPGLVSNSLTWETVLSKNFGLDFSILNRKLDVSFDYFIRDTKDMLMQKVYPGMLGATAPHANAADLRNKGWELSVTWADNIGKDWFYRINLALSDYQTTITKYTNPTGYIDDYYVGKEVGEIWGYETIGLFQTEAELANAASQSRLGTTEWALGDPHYADLNGDEEIFAGTRTLDDHGDLIRIGNTTPRYTFGINANIKYKGFKLDVFLQGIMKKDWYPQSNNMSRFYPFATYNPEQFWFEDTWTPDNTDAYFSRRRLAYGGVGSAVFGSQTRYLQNAGYMRLKNINLSYDFHLKGGANLNVFINGANLWEISGMYKLHDPEEPADLTPGYMFQRSYSLGFNLTF